MNVMSEAPPYLLALGASVCFFSAIWLSWHDKLKAATLLSGLFLLCVILAYFPQLDSIKAFSINVQLRKNLDRADEILAQIRKVSIASAKSTYMNTAWGGRLGGMSDRSKQKILDVVDEQLKSIKINDDDRNEIVQPYVELIGFDLYGIFCNSVRSVIEHDRGSEGRALANEWARTLPTDNLEYFHHLSDGSIFASYMKEQISKTSIDADDRHKLTKLADKIGHIFDDCLHSGGYTEESLKFTETYNNNKGIPNYYNILTDLQ